MRILTRVLYFLIIIFVFLCIISDKTSVAQEIHAQRDNLPKIEKVFNPTKALIGISVSFLFLIAIAALIAKTKGDKRLARKKRARLFEKIENTAKYMRKEAIKIETLRSYEILRGRLTSVEIDQKKFYGTNWNAVLNNLFDIDRKLSVVIQEANNQISLSKESRKESFVFSDKIKDLIEIIEKEVNEPAVSTKNKTCFEQVKLEFGNVLSVMNGCVKKNWCEVFEKIKNTYNKTVSLHVEIRNEISFSERAYTEGPELLSKMPKVFSDIQAEVESCKKAVGELSNVRFEFQIVKMKIANMKEVDWVVIFRDLLRIGDQALCVIDTYRAETKPKSN